MPNFTSKEERNKYYREYRQKNLEYLRKYRREHARAHRKGENYVPDKSVKTWIEANPEKVKAQKFLRIAIKYGYVKRQPCQICNNPKSHGHHEDYSKPLDVVWLCEEHHRERHPKDQA